MAIDDLLTARKGKDIWHLFDTGLAEDAVVTRAAEAGRRHVVTGIFLDYEGSLSDAETATITFGGDTLDFSIRLTNQRDQPYRPGIALDVNESVTVTLPGVVGATGGVLVTGFTIDN